MNKIIDIHNRPLEEIRLSLIDKCNYRCLYCMPDNYDYSFIKKNKLITKDEINNLVTALIKLGLKHLRLTGGEPLLRNDIIDIIQSLKKHNLQDLSLTTNGEFLVQYAQQLYDAGLKRITVSLDSIDKEKFKQITGGRGQLSNVLKGISKAKQVGLQIKINCLVKKQFSETEILPLVDWAIQQNLELRFIEYMDVGNKNNWHPSQVIPSTQVRDIISSKYHLLREEKKKKSQTAENFLIDSKYRIGFISSVSKPFCNNCNRGRISATAKLYLCLFSEDTGYNLKAYLQNGKAKELHQKLTSIWQQRDNQYSQNRHLENNKRKIEMYQIGG